MNEDLRRPRDADSLNLIRISGIDVIVLFYDQAMEELPQSKLQTTLSFVIWLMHRGSPSALNLRHVYLRVSDHEAESYLRGSDAREGR